MRYPLFQMLLALALLAPHNSLGNGNYSHLWVATDALNYLDAGDLEALLTRDDLRDVLRNGAMFPDGGYAVGDGYGEIAHWEPFQSAYLEWIRETYSPPWSDEAAQHIAFLMGMAAHGMTDQLYDGMYLKRHDHYDPPASPEPLVGLDGATDGCFAASQGVTMEIPEFFVPADELAPLFEKAASHVVTPQTLTSGQTFVKVALVAANDAVTTPATLAEYMAAYPWACSHQDDPTVPGSPVTAGRAVARYYEVLWTRLHGGTAFGEPLLGTYFTGGTPYDQPMDSSNPDSWVSFVMPFGLEPSTINGESVVVSYGEGQTHPVSLKVYYGHNSHLVNIRPGEDWPDATEFTVTIRAPVASWDGQEMTVEHVFNFATLPEPEVVTEPEVEAPIEMAGADLVTEPEVGGAVDSMAADWATDGYTTDIGADTKPSSQGGCSAGTPGGQDLSWFLLLLLLCVAGLRYRAGSM